MFRFWQFNIRSFEFHYDERSLEVFRFWVQVLKKIIMTYWSTASALVLPIEPLTDERPSSPHLAPGFLSIWTLPVFNATHRKPIDLFWYVRTFRRKKTYAHFSTLSLFPLSTWSVLIKKYLPILHIPC